MSSSSNTQSRQRTALITFFLTSMLLLGTCLTIQQTDTVTSITVGSPVSAALSVVTPPFPNAAPQAHEFTVPILVRDSLFEMPSGAELYVPSGAFRDSTGARLNEPVLVTYTEYLNPLESVLGGVPLILSDSSALRSAGMARIEAAPLSGLGTVSIAPDQPLSLTFEGLNNEPGFGTWVMDDVTGKWTELDVPVTLEEENIQKAIESAENALPPAPVVATASSFTVTDETGFFEDLERYKNVRFEPVDGEPCGFTATHVYVEPGEKGIYNVHFTAKIHFDGYVGLLTVREETCPCYLAFYEGAEYDEELENYQRRYARQIERRNREYKRLERQIDRYNRAIERQALGRWDAKFAEAKSERLATRISRTLQISDFGLINIDKLEMYPSEVDVMAEFIDAEGNSLEVSEVHVLRLSDNALFSSTPARVRFDDRQRNVMIAVLADEQLAYLTEGQLRQERIESDAKSHTFRMSVADGASLTYLDIHALLFPT